MEKKTKKLLVSKVNEIKNIDSLFGLQKEISPLIDTISKDECPDEFLQLQMIIDEINKSLKDDLNNDPRKNLNKTKKKIENILCDLLCF